jgi:hypothetical protein
VLRSLTWYWRTSLALVAGAAVATSVLTGALVVGDSVRWSLESLVEERLGGIGSALVAPRFVPESLASRLEGGTGGRVAPTILVPGAAVQPDSGRRASGIMIVGLDERFLEVYGAALDLERRSGQIFPSVALNEPLAAELGVVVGDPVILSFGSVSGVPRETLIGRRTGDEAVDSLRLTVASVLPDEGLGRFSLRAGQDRPATAFVALERLQRSLGQAGRVNALVAEETEADRLNEAFASVLDFEDLGLRLRQSFGPTVLESRELVVSHAAADAADEAARALGLSTARVYTYIANEIAAGDRALPYSTVAGLDLAAFAEERTDASSRDLPPIVLNDWAAENLSARPGATIRLAYYQVGPDETLSSATAELRLAGVVPTSGLGADPTLTPELPGLTDADDMAGWDPPFPVDLARIRSEDETYWDAHRAAPKAFVPLRIAQELWGTRFGDVTSVRIGGGPGGEPPDPDLLARHLLQRLDPTRMGLSFRPLRQASLAAARGATDFAGLFSGFSLFLVASALLLSGLLFRLALEQRAAEIGLLRATGFPSRAVRRRFLAQGLLLAATGALAGTGGAALYGAWMLYGLRTWWLPAIGEPVLFLHLDPATLLFGATLALALVFLVVAWSLRQLRRTSAVALLAGDTRPGPTPSTAGRWPRRIAWSGLLLGGGLLGGAGVAGQAASPALALGGGAALLVGGVAWFAAAAGGRPRSDHQEQALRGPAVLAMGARNAGRALDRSVLSVALVASACFVIVLVGAYRVEDELAVEDPASGAGGYSLVATSDVSLIGDLSRHEIRQELGFDGNAEAIVAGVDVVPFRVRPGEDASCLNLYRPTEPRIAGAPAGFLELGRFRFRDAIDDRANPWTLLAEDLGDAIPAIGDYNSVVWILHSGLGEAVNVRAENGEMVPLRIVGLLDRSLFQSELVVSEESFLRLFPSLTGSRLFLLETPAGANAGRVAGAFEASLAPYGFDAVPTADRLRAFGAVERTYLSTFQALGGLGLVLGTLGLGLVMLRNVLERRRELAALRAFGFRPAVLARLVWAENAVLLIVGLVVGSGAGLAAGAPNLFAAGRTVPWGEVSLTLLAVWLVGTLSTVLAARRAARAPLLATLKEE